MVDVSTKIKGIIDAFIDKGKYFTINRARQYGKTTTLYMLERALQKEYIVISLSFEAADIVTMLEDYEKAHEIGMDKNAVADELYAYTSGYPYLVSRLCQLIDENLQNSVNWNYQGIFAAVRLLVKDKNTLFDDIQKKLFDYPELKEVLFDMLFKGIVYPYHANNSLVSIGEDLGFVKEVDNLVVIANRIYEIWLYNFFIAEDALNNKTYEAGLQAKNTLQISQ